MQLNKNVINIYYYRISDYSVSDLFLNLPFCFSGYENKRIKRYHKENDQKRSLVGKIAIAKIISKFFNIGEKELVFIRDDYGKPILKKPFNKGFDFNISHSGDYVVVAINRNGKIGIDIEKIKSIDLEIAKNVFTKDEIRYLYSDKNKILERFFKLWTLKESFVKAIGEGLSFPLQEFHFEFKDDKIIHNTQQTNSNWNFFTKNIESNHKMAVCFDNKKPLIKECKNNLLVYKT